MSAVVRRFHSLLRNRWRSWLVVGLLIAMFGGVVLAAAAGARRTDTAYQRFTVAAHAAQLTVEDFIPNPDAAVVTHRQVASTAGVAEADHFRSFAFSNTGALAGDNIVATPDGRAYGSGLNRLKLLAGRLPDPHHAGEIAADFTNDTLAVGSVVRLHFNPNLGGDPHRIDLHAPPISETFHVVGIVAVPGQFPPQSDTHYFTGPTLYATPAFYRANQARLAGLDFDLVSTGPKASPTLVEAGLQRFGHVASYGLHDQALEVEHSMHLDAVALWLLAGVLALVGGLIVFQLISRLTVVECDDDPTLRAIGMTRAQLVSSSMLRSGVLAVVGAAGAVALAVPLSALTPIGLASRAEPAPGAMLDAGIVAPGTAVLLVFVASSGLFAALRTTTRVSSVASARPGVGAVLATRAGGAGAPAPLTCGIQMALDPGRGATTVPVRSTLLTAVVSLTALAAAVTFGSSLTHLLDSPPLYGVTWQTEIWNNDGPDAVPAAVPIVRHDPDVSAAAYRYGTLEFSLDGFVTQGAAFVPIKGTIGPTVVQGAIPAGPGEIGVGARTLAALDRRIGQSVWGIAENEHAHPVRVRIVSKVVLPPGSTVARLGDGVVVPLATLQHMAGDGYQLRRPYIIAVRFRPGADAAAPARLRHLLTGNDRQFFLQAPPTPTDIVNFGQVQNLPVILAGLVGVMAAATLAHLLMSSVRRRRRDLSILKTIGMTRGQVMRTVWVQAIALTGLALCVGLPLGVAAGRILWQVFADQLGVVPVPEVPVLVLTLLAVSALALAVAISVVPGLIGARVRPHHGLRPE